MSVISPSGVMRSYSPKSRKAARSLYLSLNSAALISPRLDGILP